MFIFASVYAGFGSYPPFWGVDRFWRGYDVWMEYREARNRTSHTYNEDQALAVVAIVPKFLEEAKFLQGRLQEEMGNG